MQEPVALATLVELVRRRAPGGPLDRVEASRIVGDELTSAADELLGYFIDEARHAGQSWTAIGQRLGVSKQAARQRFGEPTASATAAGLPVMPRLQTCLEAAAREAMDDGSGEIGTHHQLIGLFREGVASAVLEKIGLRVDAVRATARDLFPPGSASAEPPPSSLEARQAIERATRMATQAKGSYVGTEHLLYAIAFDPGSGARRVLTRLEVNLARLKQELGCYLEGPKKRRRRRGKFDSTGCSFCGRCGLDGVRLVAGPSVWICDECVQLCTEILVEEEQGN